MKIAHRLSFLIVFGMLVGLPVSGNAGKWSNFIIVSTENDVVVSYQQRMQKDGWFVEWKVENNSADWVEPVVKTRRYLCADGNSKTEKGKTLGPYPPGDTRKGSIRDRGVCPVSEIQSVKVDIELRPVSESFGRCGNSRR